MKELVIFHLNYNDKFGTNIRWSFQLYNQNESSDRRNSSVNRNKFLFGRIVPTPIRTGREQFITDYNRKETVIREDTLEVKFYQPV